MVKKTLVLGASLNTQKYSNKAVKALISKGLNVVALGHKVGFIDKVKVIKAKKIYNNIHTVTIYLNKKFQGQFYNYVLELNPKRVIFNPGTENHEFYKILEKISINYQESCTLVLLSTDQF